MKTSKQKRLAAVAATYGIWKNIKFEEEEEMDRGYFDVVACYENTKTGKRFFIDQPCANYKGSMYHPAEFVTQFCFSNTTEHQACLQRAMDWEAMEKKQCIALYEDKKNGDAFYVVYPDGDYKGKRYAPAEYFGEIDISESDNTNNMKTNNMKEAVEKAKNWVKERLDNQKGDRMEMAIKCKYLEIDIKNAKNQIDVIRDDIRRDVERIKKLRNNIAEDEQKIEDMKNGKW